MSTPQPPYNPSNRVVELKDVQAIFSRFGLPGQVRNLNLYRRAFVHRSYTRDHYRHNEGVLGSSPPPGCLKLMRKSNERLEFMGDGVLECFTKYYLYRRFPKEDEGFMTEKKIAIVKNEHLGKLAIAMNLHKWLVVSSAEEEANARGNVKKLGCLFEAFLGAVFLDFNGMEIDDSAGMFRHFFHTGPGYEMAAVFLTGVFNTIVNWNAILHSIDNYKNILQLMVQKRWKTLPMYITLRSDPSFEIGVFVRLGANDQILDPANATPFEEFGSVDGVDRHYARVGYAFVRLGSATHSVKKKAEQIACKLTIDYLESAQRALSSRTLRA